jgi:hypothetical protein
VGSARALSCGAPLSQALAFAFAFAFACAAAAAAPAETFDVSVACRDGVPNGAYEAHDGEGRLRIAGALAHGHRTGTFIFWDARGARLAVIPYDNGRKVGTVALWHPPGGSTHEGRRRLEAPYAGGMRHGVTRSWHDNGRPRAEVRYEHGRIAEARAWRRSGAELAPDDASAQAVRDAAAADALFAELESLVARNVPLCGAIAPRS